MSREDPGEPVLCTLAHLLVVAAVVAFAMWAVWYMP